MKVLVFHIGPDRYALRLTVVSRVLPAAALKSVPLAPSYVAGLLDLHGEAVPVIDLSRLSGIVPDQVWFDSRIILVDYVVDYAAGHVADHAVGSATRKLGLLAEHVLGVDSIAAHALSDSGVDGAPFLGQVAGTENGLLQLVELGELLAPDVRALLFQQERATP